ncbi:dynamin family protein [Streptomyces sp. NPDC006512]|uniref:dynamin family protein n=1 Tax=Streptomyces sp. NPDC006512 TaxID=3154307 RepID=UPI0033AD389E
MPDDTLDLTGLPDALDRHHALLPQPEPAVTEALAALRDACERSHLAVVGPEAAGKSTLVNALVGAEVTPVSAGLPGTVAPVHVLYGPAHDPRYRVLRRTEGADPGRPGTGQRVTDRTAFEQWMLQAHNPDNEREVLRGEIELPAALLRNGLRLVDLPGIAGVSGHVAAQTERDLDGHAFSVVLVSLGRASLKGLVDIVRELRDGPRPARVAAVVFNEIDPRPLTPERLGDHLAMRRRSVAELLLPHDEDGSLGLAQASLHCLNLLAPDEAALESLRTRLLERIRRDVGDTVAHTAQYAFPVLGAALDRRRARTNDVLAGRIGREEIRRHRDEVLAGVGYRYRLAPFVPSPGGDVLATIEGATRKADWLGVEQVFLAEARRLDTLLETHKSRIMGPVMITKSEANAINTEVRAALDESRTRISAAAKPGLSRLAADLDEYAREREARFDALIPTELYRSTGRAASVGAVQVGSYHYESAGDAFEREVEDDGLVGLLGAVWYVPYHYLGGGHRGYSLREIRKSRGRISSLLLGTSEAPAEGWLARRRSLVAAARDDLVKRIGSLGDMAAERPASLTSALRRHLDRLDGAREDLAAQRKLLGPGKVRPAG